MTYIDKATKAKLMTGYIGAFHHVSFVTSARVSFWPLSIKRKLVKAKRQRRARTGRRS